MQEKKFHKKPIKKVAKSIDSTKIYGTIKS